MERAFGTDYRTVPRGCLSDPDYAAARAALAEPWSSGQAEGEINLLKMLKRQMYGRAGFDLLRKRILCAV